MNRSVIQYLEESFNKNGLTKKKLIINGFKSVLIWNSVTDDWVDDKKDIIKKQIEKNWNSILDQSKKFSNKINIENIKPFECFVLPDNKGISIMLTNDKKTSNYLGVIIDNNGTLKNVFIGNQLT